ncbi:hypothetical protein CALCODRAFT_485012 [Calocera cornea HHB12733]|uniref:Uncharacterized protein n=1 Tax=Calocera cornea HHB12733 TaxID=1353952 RepID=A0A165EMU7_9BASI|nr:hypothetical protein CALCODRAFT_485012 [Calocera cornea HHB12733]
MTGNGDLWLTDGSGKQIHQFGMTGENTVATIRMWVNDRVHPLMKLQELGNSVKLGEPGGTEKVVIAW